MNTEQSNQAIIGGRGLKAIMIGSSTSALDDNTQMVILVVGVDCKISSAKFTDLNNNETTVTDYNVTTLEQIVIPNSYNGEAGVWSDIVNEGTGQITAYLI